MKYLTLSTALVATFLSFGDARATCGDWFNGSTSCSGESSLSAKYWACRSTFATAYTICAGIIGGDTSQERLDAAKEKCQPGADQKACEAALQDISTDMADIVKIVVENEQKIKNDLDKDLESQAAELTKRR